MKTELPAATCGLFVTAVAHADGTAATKIGKPLADSAPGTAPELPMAKGAPNVIWILLDDVGYGASSMFGGATRTPVP